MKVFISVPMRGRSASDIREDIEAAKHDFGFNGRKTHYIDNFIDGEEMSPLNGLSRALKLMDECDAVYMCPGWMDHYGCVIEFMTALAYNIPVYGAVEHDDQWAVVSRKNPEETKWEVKRCL